MSAPLSGTASGVNLSKALEKSTFTSVFIAALWAQVALWGQGHWLRWFFIDGGSGDWPWLYYIVFLKITNPDICVNNLQYLRFIDVRDSLLKYIYLHGSVPIPT